MTDEEREIWDLIRESNRARREGAIHELENVFDERAVIITPRIQGRIVGRDAIVKRYADFVSHARTDSFEEMEHCVDVIGETAVATYRFRIRYQIHSEEAPRDEVGQEIVVLHKRPDGWKIIWRTQTEPESAD
jgi:uncharacterized protein (TIGR02246 family)